MVVMNNGKLARPGFSHRPLPGSEQAPKPTPELPRTKLPRQGQPPPGAVPGPGGGQPVPQEQGGKGCRAPPPVAVLGQCFHTKGRRQPRNGVRKKATAEQETRTVSQHRGPHFTTARCEENETMAQTTGVPTGGVATGF